jgi:RNA polymerase subunit RPABC4/transcription elongation factor Spt4
MQETKTCKYCQSEIDKKAKICPNCRKKQGGNIKWIVAVIVAIIIINAIANGGDDTETSNANSSTAETKSIESSEASNATEATEKVETEKVETEPATTSPVEEKPSLTMGQKNALSKADSYLDYTAFSYSGLITQLEFEGFSNEDATYAADNCGADWNEQAALKAEQYLDYSSFSRDGLIEQLEFEGFTSEQAEYGVTAVGY